jgi:HK97 family phage portal protein
VSLIGRATRGFKGIDQVAQSEYGATYVPLENHQTWTGLATTPDTALNIITVYQCVRVLAETFASLPLIVYRRLPGGGKERAPDHPWYDVLHGRPNPDMTSFVWRELLMSHLATWGNGYNEIATGQFNRPVLWPLRPDRMQPSYDDNGKKVYDYLRPDGQKQRMAPGSVFHVPGLSYSGLVGYSPIALMRSTTTLLRTAETYGTNFLRNGARPAVVLQHPKLLSTTAVSRLQAQMDELRGAGNSGKTVVLEEGMTLTEIGIPPEDAQYMETRLFQKREIAAAFRVPPHKIGDLERATFSNIEHQSLEFISDTMLPWLVRVEQQINADLIADDQYFAEFLVEGYLRGDSKTRAEAFAIRWQHGNFNSDDWRAAENENPLPNGMGQEYFVPANYVPVSRALVTPDLTGDAPSDTIGVTAPQLTVIKSWGAFRCPDCGKLINRQAAPGTVGYCPGCKAEKTMAGEMQPDPWAGLAEAIVSALPAPAPQVAPVVNVHEPTEPPVINIPAPIVNVEKPDAPVVHVHTDSFVAAVEDLKTLMAAPRNKRVERDENGRIVGLVDG